MNWRRPTSPRWVRYDIPTALSRLFTPLPKSRQRPRLNIVYQQEGRLELRFSAREALGVPEQTLVLAILELAGERFFRFGDDQVLNQTSVDHVGAMLWSDLFPDGPWEGAQTLRVDTSLEELNLRTGNTKGGSANEVRRQSLVRLCEVVVWEKCLLSGTVHQSYLVRWLTGDDRRIHLALNPRLAAGFFQGQYAKVSLAERLQLPSDLAMAVHAFLSTTTRPSHQSFIRPKTLAARMWPDTHDSAPAGTVRRRDGELVRALEAVGRLPSWTVFWGSKGVATINRRIESQSRDRSTSTASTTSAGHHPCALPGVHAKEDGIAPYDISGLLG